MEVHKLKQAGVLTMFVLEKMKTSWGVFDMFGQKERIFFHKVIGNMMKEILKFCQNVMALMSFQISMTCFSKLVFAQIN